MNKLILWTNALVFPVALTAQNQTHSDTEKYRIIATIAFPLLLLGLLILYYMFTTKRKKKA